jgi:hypothetical protein
MLERHYTTFALHKGMRLLQEESSDIAFGQKNVNGCVENDVLLVVFICICRILYGIINAVQIAMGTYFVNSLYTYRLIG